MINLPTGQQASITVKPAKPTRYQTTVPGYIPGPQRLSPREYEVLQLLLAGKSGKEMSTSLGVHEKTVKFHKTRLFIKYKVKSVTQLLAALLAEKECQIRQLKQNCSDFADIIAKDSTDRIVRAWSNK
jgi:DNA-binding CsgD family transcriptional regulator